MIGLLTSLFLVSVVSAQPAPSQDVRIARMPFGICSKSTRICKYWRPDGANSLAAREELFRNERLDSSIYISPTATLSMQQKFAKLISDVNKAKQKKLKCKPEYTITSGSISLSKIEVCLAQLPESLKVQIKNLLR